MLSKWQKPRFKPITSDSGSNVLSMTTSLLLCYWPKFFWNPLSFILAAWKLMCFVALGKIPWWGKNVHLFACDFMQSAAAEPRFLICNMGAKGKSGQREVNLCRSPGTGLAESAIQQCELSSFTSPGLSEPKALRIEALQLRSWSVIRNQEDRLWKGLTIFHDIKSQEIWCKVP